MPAQIQPTRIDVTDRFPMLAFKIKADQGVSQAEVAIGTDPALFSAEGKKDRTSANFYSTNGNGAVRFNRGETGFTVPPEVLARFIGNEKLYFGLATAGEGGAMKVAVMPSTASPYISIKGLSGRSMARVRVLPNRQQRAASYGRNGQAQLEWAGDAAQPGMTTVVNGNGAAPAINGKTNGGSASTAAPYDDGFGPMPGDAPQAAPAPAVSAPAAQGLARQRARGFDYTDDAESRGIGGPAYSESATLPTAQARTLSVPTPDYPRASRFSSSPAFTAGRAGQAIDRIVIHITDAPTTSSTVNAFTAPGAQASAHYLVGQDGEVMQFVIEADTAWHAKGANRRSIGIEHVAIKRGGADYPRRDGTMQHFDYLPPTDTQYCESAALVTYLCDKYGLNPDRTTIIGHREADPNTSHSSCPDGAWNWDHFMDLVTNRYCAPQPAEAQGFSMRARNGGGRRPMARAMIIGPDDVQRAQQYAPQWLDLWTFRCSPAIEQQIQARGMQLQLIANAAGELNLDRYEVQIDRFPPGWDAPSLLASIRSNMNAYINTGNTEFNPYSAEDATLLASANPLGAVINLNIFGPDNAAVVVSDVQPTWFRVSTISTPDTGSHPVTGTREWGYRPIEGGGAVFYTRGCDRATYGIAEFAAWAGADNFWTSFQNRLADWANGNGGAATVLPKFSERFHPNVVAILFGPAAQALSSGDSWTINWDDVELIPQPTNFSCWAAAGAMVVGWRDMISLSPDSVASICGRTTATGLAPGDVERFARDMGLSTERPACYTEEGFRSLLASNGPLWVAAAVPSLHAIVVTGMYNDGVNTYVRISDPWDRAVGSPGAPGGYATTHTTGSRYIMAYADFCAEYEGAAGAFPAAGVQIIHSGGTGLRQPNRGPNTPPGYAQSYAQNSSRTQARRMPAARGLSGGQSFTINWDDVQQIAQPTNVSCWATAASMVLGWRDRMSLTVEGISERAGLTTATGLDPAQVGQFAADMGLISEPPQSYTVEAFQQLLANNGPLWVGAAVPGLHAIVVTGLYGDGNDTYVRITDPWDRDIGVPGTPGAYADTHVTGSRYIMRWADFVAEYERAATDFAKVNLQILHSGGVFGHVANTGGSTPPGYAMAADDGAVAPPPSDADVTLFPPPPPRARALDAISTVSAIGGILPQVLSDNSGDISWELDQFRGLKHPSDRAPANPPLFTDAPTIRLDDWPKLALYGIDDIYAWFTIDWQHNGKSLGNVRIGNIATNDAKGMKLKVRAQIMDDNILYEPGGIAALRVRFYYRFSRLVGDDIIAVTNLQLFADGTHLRESNWLQKSTI